MIVPKSHNFVERSFQINNRSTSFMKKLDNRIALVTGASKGIGAGIAKSLAAEGATVIVNYASAKAAAEKTVEEITAAGGKAIALQADVSKQADVKRLFSEIISQVGQLDILVNNAGVYEFAEISQITEEHYHRHFNLNVWGLLMVTKAAVESFGERGGSIINIGSAVSRLGTPSTVVYTATKGAVDAISLVLSKELGPKKIRVNSINPGMVETEGAHTTGMMSSEFPAMIAAMAPLGRIGQPDDISPIAVFLASDDSKWLTGETLIASGGMR